MSDTPITDAAASPTMFIDGEPVVEIKICRDLERKLQKAQADAAAMREALNAIPFPCPCCSYATMHAGICAIGSALSADAGRELLEELHRLRAELKSTREEVERARSDRNKAGVEERRKYLPKIQELTGELAKAYAELKSTREELDDVRAVFQHGADQDHWTPGTSIADAVRSLSASLAKAQAQCAEKDAALKRCLPNWEIEPDDADGHICCEITNGDVRAIKSALSPDCGRDYVHRSEVEKAVEKAYAEGFSSRGNGTPINALAECYKSSRAKKVMEGKL